MAEQVQYELSLKDLLTGKLKEADGAAKKLEGTMGMVKSALGVLGVGFAVFKGAEFVKDAVEGFHKLEQANAQVKAGIESTKGAAGLTFEDVQKSAKGLAAELPYSRSALLEMQSILLTFPSVTKESFTPASAIIADMSTRLGQDLKSSAIQVGKALQDPIKGVTALRRVGVNFNETQTEMIRKMVEGGHTAQAQAAIMKELNVEFGGSAKAAADADPMFKFNKSMDIFKNAVGEAGMEVLQVLQPALESIGDIFVSVGGGIKSFIEFLKENKEIVNSLAAGIGVAAGALIIYTTYTKAAATWTLIHTAYVNASAMAAYIYGNAQEVAAGKAGILTMAQWALNVALTANPIGVVVVALVAAGAAFYALYEKCQTFRAIIWAIGAVVKEFVSLVIDYFAGFYHVIHGAFTLNPSEIKDGMLQTYHAVTDAADRLGKAATEGFANGVKDFAKDKYTQSIVEGIDLIKKKHDEGTMSALAYNNAVANMKESLNKGLKSGLLTNEDYEKGWNKLTNKGIKPGAPDKDNTPAKDVSPAKAQGQKSVTINISINKLIEQFKISTVNMQESGSKISEMVSNALLQAVNDSSIQAGI